MFWLVRLYAFAGLVLVAGVVFSALAVYSYFSLHAPAVPDLRIYARVVPAVSHRLMTALPRLLMSQATFGWSGP